jgi:hypothetical protein
MIRILSALIVAATALLATSCCCTGEPKPPRLRSLPHFQEIEAAPVMAPAPQVLREK